jgi:hypothetical protein
MMVQLWRKQTARERSMIQHTASFAGARDSICPPRKDPWKLLDRRIGLSPGPQPGPQPGPHPGPHPKHNSHAQHTIPAGLPPTSNPYPHTHMHTHTHAAVSTSTVRARRTTRDTTERDAHVRHTRRRR